VSKHAANVAQREADLVLSLHVALGPRRGDVSQNFIFDFESYRTMLFVPRRVPHHPRSSVVRENGIDEDSVLSDQSWFGLILQVAVYVLRTGRSVHTETRQRRGRFIERFATYPIKRLNDEGDTKVAPNQWGRHVRHHSLVEVKRISQVREHAPVLLPRVLRNTANEFEQLHRLHFLRRSSQTNDIA
jgi:hypothetical protein